MAENVQPSVRFLLRLCGLALVVAGLLIVLATLLHPPNETAKTIVASESTLVAVHVVYTVAWLLVLLGLPGLYVAHHSGMGRPGLAGFLTAFSRTYLSGDRKLRFPRPSVSQTVAASAGLHQPILPGGDH